MSEAAQAAPRMGGESSASVGVGSLAAKSLGGASSSSAAVMPPGQSAKFDICVQALMSGCVHSFVSVFSVSHRPPVCVDPLAQLMFTVPDDKLSWILERSMNAELARRRSQFRTVLDENYLLSEYFEACGDREQAVRCHLAALHHASESSDVGLEVEAHKRAAELYERVGMLAEATVHFESRLRLAELATDPQAKVEASRPLVKVFLKRGHAMLSEGRFEVAKQLFENAVHVSKVAQDANGEAEAYAALGNVTVVMGDMKKALDYQRRFFTVAKAANNTTAQSAAALEVAKLQDSLGQSVEAIESLKQALEVAEVADDVRSINEACRLLGEAYRRQPGGMTKAVHYFREHFRVSKDLGDPLVLESARVSLGLALGEHHFTSAGSQGGFLEVCVDDLPNLLEWLGTGNM